MGKREVEVRSFKQQGGENLKDAWYRINESHRRCTKKYSTLILLRNFYVGITSWDRHVLDTLTGGNFLGIPAQEACNLIEGLVGIPPIKDTKTETTLEDVMKKLDSIEKNLPNFLDNISKINESVVSINKRITVLEDSDTQITHGNRIGELEEVMETLRSTFSSLNSKNEKAFVGREKKFIYVPKMPKPMFSGVSKVSKSFETINGNLHNESLSSLSKVPSCFFEEITYASSLGNT